MSPRHGHVFWLCELSGAGKSTLATALAGSLRARGIPVLALDGDILREGVCHGLGFSSTDCAENLRRAAEIAKLGAASGLCTVASFITPLEVNRQTVHDILGPTGWSLVFVHAPLEVCRQRDVKGLYSRASQGNVPQMTGLSSPFEPPTTPGLVIRTAEELPAISADKLLKFVLAQLQSAPS